MQLQFNFDPSQGPQERSFWVFHDGHPQVWEALVRRAFEWRAVNGSGVSLGVKKLYEEVRWDEDIPLGDQLPKLNNNHTAYYARLLMEQHPELRGMFKLRRQRIAASFGPDNDSLPPNIHLP